jgi:hypothetical protein
MHQGVRPPPLTSESKTRPPGPCELELELIQTHIIQKPMLRVEVCTRALRASQNVKKKMRALCVRSADGAGECGDGYGDACSIGDDDSPPPERLPCLWGVRPPPSHL